MTPSDSTHMEQPPKQQVVVKFLLLCLLLVGYFIYLNLHYDLLTSGMTALLTWSFFVLCTPIADAGFLLDFPLRLLFGIRMVYSELLVWVLAISMNLYAIFAAPHYYQTTPLTRIFQSILTTPYPYWGVIALSGIGTFLSVHFGDELMDVLHHRDRTLYHRHGFKRELIVIAGLFALIAIGYYELIASLGIDRYL